MSEKLMMFASFEQKMTEVTISWLTIVMNLRGTNMLEEDVIFQYKMINQINSNRETQSTQDRNSDSKSNQTRADRSRIIQQAYDTSQSLKKYSSIDRPKQLSQIQLMPQTNQTKLVQKVHNNFTHMSLASPQQNSGRGEQATQALMERDLIIRRQTVEIEKYKLKVERLTKQLEDTTSIMNGQDQVIADLRAGIQLSPKSQLQSISEDSTLQEENQKLKQEIELLRSGKNINPQTVKQLEAQFSKMAKLLDQKELELDILRKQLRFYQTCKNRHSESMEYMTIDAPSYGTSPESHLSLNSPQIIVSPPEYCQTGNSRRTLSGIDSRLNHIRSHIGINPQQLGNRQTFHTFSQQPY